MKTFDFIDFLFEDYPYGYWLSKDGDLVRVGFQGHHAGANKVLRNLPKYAEHFKTQYDNMSFQKAYEAMFNEGYVRVVLGDVTDRVDAPPGKELTRRQMSALKDLAIERNTRVLMSNRDGGPTKFIYEPEPTPEYAQPDTDYAFP